MTTNYTSSHVWNQAQRRVARSMRCLLGRCLGLWIDNDVRARSNRGVPGSRAGLVPHQGGRERSRPRHLLRPDPSVETLRLTAARARGAHTGALPRCKSLQMVRAEGGSIPTSGAAQKAAQPSEESKGYASRGNEWSRSGLNRRPPACHAGSRDGVKPDDVDDCESAPLLRALETRTRAVVVAGGASC